MSPERGSAAPEPSGLRQSALSVVIQPLPEVRASRIACVDVG